MTVNVTLDGFCSSAKVYQGGTTTLSFAADITNATGWSAAWEIRKTASSPVLQCGDTAMFSNGQFIDTNKITVPPGLYKLYGNVSDGVTCNVSEMSLVVCPAAVAVCDPIDQSKLEQLCELAENAPDNGLFVGG